VPARRQAADYPGQWTGIIPALITDDGIAQARQDGLIAIAVNNDVVDLRRQSCQNMGDERASGKVDQGFINAAQAGGKTTGQYNGRAGNGGH